MSFPTLFVKYEEVKIVLLNLIMIRSIKVLQTIEKKIVLFCLTFKCNLLLFVIEVLALLKNVSL